MLMLPSYAAAGRPRGALRAAQGSGWQRTFVCVSSKNKYGGCERRAKAKTGRIFDFPLQASTLDAVSWSPDAGELSRLLRTAVWTTGVTRKRFSARDTARRLHSTRERCLHLWLGAENIFNFVNWTQNSATFSRFMREASRSGGLPGKAIALKIKFLRTIFI
ncbi:MAG: hypothetical protein ACRDCT_19880 [Shewanella sp.]